MDEIVNQVSEFFRGVINYKSCSKAYSLKRLLTNPACSSTALIRHTLYAGVLFLTMLVD